MHFKVKSLTLFIFLIHCFAGFTQNIDDIDYGTPSTLEIISWNIENFPKKEATTVGKVGDIIEALNADIIAIQEVDDRNSFNEMVANLESYEGYLESEWFAGLAFIYNKNTIEINSIYEIYTTSQYWSPFPRSPMVMDFNFKNQRYIVINNHLKCFNSNFKRFNNHSKCTDSTVKLRFFHGS